MISPKGPLCCQCRGAFASGPALSRGASGVLIVFDVNKSCWGHNLMELLTSSITRLALFSQYFTDGQGFFFSCFFFFCFGSWQLIWVIYSLCSLEFLPLWNNEFLHAQVHTAERWTKRRSTCPCTLTASRFSAQHVCQLTSVTFSILNSGVVGSWVAG